MMETSARRFTLLDAMVLLVAISVPLPGVLRQLSYIADLASIKGQARYIYEVILSIVFEFLGLSTLALLLLRLRNPRPTLRQLMRQPGAAALGVPVLLWVVLVIVQSFHHFL